MRSNSFLILNEHAKMKGNGGVLGNKDFRLLTQIFQNLKRGNIEYKTNSIVKNDRTVDLEEKKLEKTVALMAVYWKLFHQRRTVEKTKLIITFSFRSSWKGNLV